MKINTIIPMTTNNIFGKALKDLLDGAKDTLSRKEWTVLLGVSDATISQGLVEKPSRPEKKSEYSSLYTGHNYPIECDMRNLRVFSASSRCLLT